MTLITRAWDSKAHSADPYQVGDLAGSQGFESPRPRNEIRESTENQETC